MSLTNNSIIENLDDGVMIIDSSGRITDANISAERILGIENLINKKYADMLSLNPNPNNDTFFNCILNAYSNRDVVHRKKLNYEKTTGEKYTLWVTSKSYYEDNTFKGMLVSFSDVTKEEVLETKRHDTTITFIIVLVTMAIWSFATVIWDFLGKPISVRVFNKFMVLLLLIPAFLIINFTTLTTNDTGLSIKGKKKYFIIDTAFTVFSLMIMIIVKMIIMKYNPSFFKTNDIINFNKINPLDSAFYIVSVVAQEFMSRGVIHESFKRVIVSKYNNGLAIIVSSLVFAAMHSHLGLGYMVGATLLLSVFGIVYSKQRSIWPLCIPHYVLGQAISLMGFTRI